MKRNYIVELDIRDMQMLEMYRMGLEQQHPVSEVDTALHDVLWQISEQYHEREAERNYEAINE